MKKITILLTSAFFAAGISGAKADSYNYTPYVGADYVFSRANAFGVNPYHHGGTLRLGSDYGKYFATELFATQSTENKRHVGEDKLATSYYAYGLDALAWLPLGESFALGATAGIGEYNYKTKFGPTNRHNEHGYGYRFGGGAKYAWNNNWQTRIMCRYVNFDKLDGYDHSMEYSFGVEYHF